MNAPMTLDEADVHAYVDGQAGEEARARVEAWLAAHPEDAARIQAYRLQNAGLHELFDGVLDEPLPARLEAAVAAPRGRWRMAPMWMRIAAALVLFAVGGAAGWGLRGMGGVAAGSEPVFVREAVGAHLVFVSEVRHPVEVGADQEAHLVGWLTKRLGNPVTAPDLTKVGFRLVGGRLLSEDGRPAAQLMYEDASGKRVTCYVRSARKSEDTAFRFVSDRGVSAFYWVDAPLAYALIGEMPRERLLTLANAVYRDIEK